MNKIIARDVFENAGIRVPRGVAFRKADYNPQYDLHQVVQMSAAPWVVKPASLGSSVGVSIVPHMGELAGAVEYAFTRDSSVLVEEYIKGREVTCGVLENFNG